MSITCIKHMACIIVDTACEWLMKCQLDFTSLLSYLLEQHAEEIAMQNMLHGHDDESFCTCVFRNTANVCIKGIEHLVEMSSAPGAVKYV